MFNILKKVFRKKPKPIYEWQVSNNYLYITKIIGNIKYDFVINKNGDIVGKSKSESKIIDGGLKRI